MSDDKAVYRFPDAEIILARLNSVDNSGSDVHRVQKMFAERNGGQVRNALCVGIQWQLALHSVSNAEGASPGIVFDLMDEQYPDYIAALIPDDFVFALECVEVYETL